jgi:hypothetical protein
VGIHLPDYTGSRYSNSRVTCVYGRYAVGRLSAWGISQSAWPRTSQATQTSVSRMGFEPTATAFEWKTVQCDRQRPTANETLLLEFRIQFGNKNWEGAEMLRWFPSSGAATVQFTRSNATGVPQFRYRNCAVNTLKCYGGSPVPGPLLRSSHAQMLRGFPSSETATARFTLSNATGVPQFRGRYCAVHTLKCYGGSPVPVPLLRGSHAQMLRGFPSSETLLPT